MVQTTQAPTIAPTESAPVECGSAEIDPRLEGLKKVGWGVLTTAGGFGLLWLFFTIFEEVDAIMGLPSLAGPSMFGYGAVQMVLGNKWRVIHWTVAVVFGLAGFATMFLLMESALGATIT